MRMKKNSALYLTVFFLSTFSIYTTGFAESKVKFSCSAQIAEAFGRDVLKLLKEDTGMELDLKVVSSQTALKRLENGFSEIIAITLPLSFEMQESGYIAIPFCKDPMAIISKDDVKVDSISSSEVANIFNGEILNWKEVGGEDKLIIKVVPCRETGAYSNFEKLFMGMKIIKYDYMTYCSVTTLSGVNVIDGAVSFISHGAAVKAKGIKILEIDGVSPENAKYRYHQTFTFVTKGHPYGAAKEFINIALSKKGQEVMKNKGMIPIIP